MLSQPGLENVTSDKDNALARMIRPASAGLGDDVPGLIACLDAAISRTARERFDVAAGIDITGFETLGPTEFVARLPGPAIHWPLRIADIGVGLLMIDSLMINGLVELATGAPDKLVFRDKRRPTEIDAALSLPFCKDFLATFAAELAQQRDLPQLPDVEFDDPETDPPRVELCLEKGAYDVIFGNVSLQEGLRGGAMVLALPGKFRRPSEGSSAVTGWARALEQNILAAPLCLRADIDRLSLTISSLLDLKPGDILPISPESLSAVTLCAGNGTILLRGQLGQKGAHKAVAVTEVT